MELRKLLCSRKPQAKYVAFLCLSKIHLNIDYLFMGRKVWEYPIPHAVTTAVFELPIHPYFLGFLKLRKGNVV